MLDSERLRLSIGLQAETKTRVLAIIDKTGEASKAQMIAAGLPKAQLDKAIPLLRDEGEIVGVSRGDPAHVVWMAYTRPPKAKRSRKS